MYILNLLFLTFSLSSAFSERNDPLFLMKKYFKEHEQFKDHKIPVVDKFQEAYDFVIIGSGSGGSVMANRLSEINDWTILILEAGEQGDFITDVPLFSRVSIYTKYDWNYINEPEEYCCLSTDGICEYARGKALGGSSVINGMAYVRGNRFNFDEWGNLGNRGWSYENALKYFKKSENIHIDALKNSTYHGQGGYLWVEQSHYQSNLTNIIFEAGKDLGYEANIDYNGAVQTGFDRLQLTTKNGRRCSAAKAYLKPVAFRKNLDIATSALATRILINPETKVAEAVEFKKDGIVHKVKARKEVIVSGGTVNSPQILMLSGIGPREHLKSFGIDVMKDLPVGKGMHDHVGLPGLKFSLDGDWTIKMDVLNSHKDISDYFEKGVGPFTVAEGNDVYSFMKSKYAEKDNDIPDFEIVFSIANMDIDAIRESAKKYESKTRFCSKANRKRNNRSLRRFIRHVGVKRDSYRIMVLVFNPKSKGRIELRSNNPEDPPKIYTNCLAEKYDRDVLIDGLKMAVKVARTKAFAKYNATLDPTPTPGCEDLVFESDEYWECAIRQVGSTLHHQVGTCKMGPASDPTAVVDHTLKVHGIKGLRVVDASIMPTIPAAHTNAVVYMIGEKAADMVKEEWLGERQHRKG